MIINDLNRYSKSLLSKIKIFLVSPSFHIVLLYRLSNLFIKIPIVGNILGLIVEYINRILYGVDISRYAKIDTGFMVVHGMGIVIGDSVNIGKNCKIFNSVNLGNKDTEISDNKQPTIGSNVVIGAGAKCLGDIKIGNNVIVGANAVVITDIEDDSIVVGIPAKSIKKRN